VEPVSKVPFFEEHGWYVSPVLDRAEFAMASGWEEYFYFFENFLGCCYTEGIGYKPLLWLMVVLMMVVVFVE